MDSKLPEHEMLLQQLEQLKRDLAEKEKKLMRLERAAQTRKSLSKATARGNISSDGEKASDHMRQNTSASDTSMNTSINDSILGNKTARQKHGDGHATVSPKINPCTHERRKQHLSEGYHHRIISSRKSGPGDKSRRTSNTASLKKKSFPLDTTKGKSSEVKTSHMCKASDTSFKKHGAKLPVACVLSTGEKSLSKKFCGTRSSGIQGSSFVRAERADCGTFIVRNELEGMASLFDKGRSSMALKSDVSTIQKCATAKLVCTSEDKKLCAKSKLSREWEKHKNGSSVSDEFPYNIVQIQNKCLVKTSVCNEVIQTEDQVVRMDCNERNSIPVLKPAVCNTLFRSVDANTSKYQKKNPKHPRTFKDHNNIDLGGNFSKELLVHEEKHGSKTEGFMPVADVITKKPKELCNTSPKMTDREMEQCTADVDHDNERHNFFSDDVVIGTQSDFPSKSFRRSQRLAKQNSVASEGKQGPYFQDRNEHSPSAIFKLILTNCDSHEIVDFDLPSEEFGLLMAIKVKNFNEEAWPPSPSESFEVITPSSFVPDSEEDKDPYSHSPSKLCSLLFEGLAQLQYNSEEPEKLPEETTQDHTSFQGSTINIERNSYLQKLPEQSATTDYFENESPQKSKKLEPHVNTEMEDFDSSILDAKKDTDDKALHLPSHPLNEFVDYEMTTNTAFNSTLQKQDTSYQGMDKDENIMQADALLANVWASMTAATLDLSPPASKNATNTVLDSETWNDQVTLPAVKNKLATGDIVRCENVTPCGNEDCNKSAGNVSDECCRNISFLCCLETKKKEPVKQVHMVPVAEEVLIAIQCDRVIEIWRKIMENKWTKIGVYNTEGMSCIEKSCLLTKEKYFICVLLICTGGSLTLKFLTFDESIRIIQVKENNSKWNRYRGQTRLLLCELEGLTFATCEGTECSSVEIHSFEGTVSEPFLKSRKLDDLPNCLFELRGIQNTPKAVMGWSVDRMYIWNYVSGNLVTVVNLMPTPLNPFDKCLWAASEEGLLFLLTTFVDQSANSCQLVAVNPMTGLWDTVQYFQHSSHKESETQNRLIDGIVLGRHVVLSCCQNGHLWDLYSGSHIASLVDCSVSSVTCAHNILAIGLQSGCTNLYSLY